MGGNTGPSPCPPRICKRKQAKLTTKPETRKVQLCRLPPRHPGIRGWTISHLCHSRTICILICGNPSALAEVYFKTSLFYSSLRIEDKMGGSGGQEGNVGKGREVDKADYYEQLCLLDLMKAGDLFP